MARGGGDGRPRCRVAEVAAAAGITATFSHPCLGSSSILLPAAPSLLHYNPSSVSQAEPPRVILELFGNIQNADNQGKMGTSGRVRERKKAISITVFDVGGAGGGHVT